MNKDFFIRWIAKAFVMVQLPWMAVAFAPGDAGMAICFLLFFAVNPVFFLLDGYRAGKRPRRRWPEPLGTTALFLLGTWLWFDWREPAFCCYALVYLALACLAMGFSWMRAKKG